MDTTIVRMATIKGTQGLNTLNNAGSNGQEIEHELKWK